MEYKIVVIKYNIRSDECVLEVDFTNVRVAIVSQKIT